MARRKHDIVRNWLVPSLIITCCISFLILFRSLGREDSQNHTQVITVKPSFSSVEDDIYPISPSASNVRKYSNRLHTIKDGPETSKIWGYAVDQDGNYIPDANISVYLQTPDGVWRLVADVFSGKDGCYSCDMGSTGTYKISGATQNGDIASSVEISLRAEGAVIRQDLVYRTATEISGTVVSNTEIIERVQLYPLAGNEQSAIVSEVNDDGTFLFKNVETGRYFLSVDTSRRHIPLKLITAPAKNLMFNLNENIGAVSGEIIADSIPDHLLEKTVVMLTPTSIPFDAASHANSFIGQNSGGKFTFTQIPANRYRCTALLEGIGEFLDFSYRRGIVTVDAGRETSGVLLELGVVPHLAGNVIDQLTSRPISGVKINVFDESFSLLGECTTADDGKFTIEDLKLSGSSELHIAAIKSGYYLIPPNNKARMVTIHQQKATSHSVVLHMGKSVEMSGEVLSSGGHPVANCIVSMNCDQLPIGLEKTQLVTDFSGTFSFDVPPFCDVYFTCSAKGYLDLISQFYSSSAYGNSNVTLRFPSEMHISGIVVDGKGHSIGGADVQFSASPNKSKEANIASIASRSNGTFSTRGLPSENLYVRASRLPDYAFSEWRKVENNGNLVTVALEKATDISGILITADGKPVPHTIVNAKSQITGTSYSALSDEQGLFVISQIPMAKYLLSAYNEFYGVASLIIPASSNDVELKFPEQEYFPLELLITDKYSGIPIESAYIVTSDGVSALALGGGKYFVEEALCAGVRATITVNGYTPLSTEVIKPVTCGEPHREVINLSPTVSVSGKIIPTGGEFAPSSVTVFCTTSEANLSLPDQMVMAGNDGSFKLTNLPTGWIKLLIIDPVSERKLELDYKVVPGADNDIGVIDF